MNGWMGEAIIDGWVGGWMDGRPKLFAKQKSAINLFCIVLKTLMGLPLWHRW